MTKKGFRFFVLEFFSTWKIWELFWKLSSLMDLSYFGIYRAYWILLIRVLIRFFWIIWKLFSQYLMRDPCEYMYPGSQMSLVSTRSRAEESIVTVFIETPVSYCTKVRSHFVMKVGRAHSKSIEFAKGSWKK